MSVFEKGKIQNSGRYSCFIRIRDVGKARLSKAVFTDIRPASSFGSKSTW